MDYLSEATEPEFKMVFVVNTQLDMGRGKQCAQVAHAAVTLSSILLTGNSDEDSLHYHLWFTSGQKKIVLKGENLEQMVALQERAIAAGLRSHIVTDAGYTQIAPGSKTVLAIFGTVQQVDSITGSLQLL